MRNFWLVVLTGFSLTACATAIDGNTQEIMIATSPSGADCMLIREGGLIVGRVNPTPGSTTIRKTKEDITVVCHKAGFQEATYYNHSGVDAWTFADILGNPLTYWAIDSASGSDNKYDSPLNITLQPTLPRATSELPQATRPQTE